LASSETRPFVRRTGIRPMGDHRPVTVFIRIRRFASVALAGCALVWAPALAAQSDVPPLSGSPLGSYLAARHAGAQRDSTAAAAYYLSALRADPRNTALLERTVRSGLADGRTRSACRATPSRPRTSSSPAGSCCTCSPTPCQSAPGRGC
jgi:hypothetical protein